jgi:hypothetical protein
MPLTLLSMPGSHLSRYHKSERIWSRARPYIRRHLVRNLKLPFRTFQTSLENAVCQPQQQQIFRLDTRASSKLDFPLSLSLGSCKDLRQIQGLLIRIHTANLSKGHMSYLWTHEHETCTKDQESRTNRPSTRLLVLVEKVPPPHMYSVHSDATFVDKESELPRLSRQSSNAASRHPPSQASPEPPQRP